MNKSIRSRLITAIHAAKNSAGLDDQAYRAVLHGAVGKESCSECGVQELRAVQKAMNSVLALQGKSPWKLYPRNKVPALIDAVEARARKLLGADWKKRLDHFALSKFKKETYSKCSDNELRSVMAFMTNLERRERESK